MNEFNTLDKAKAIHEKLISWRRDFHMHPELGFSEHRTSGKVVEVLQDLGG